LRRRCGRFFNGAFGNPSSGHWASTFHVGHAAKRAGEIDHFEEAHAPAG
jgi:hypothetical protein